MLESERDEQVKEMEKDIQTLKEVAVIVLSILHKHKTVSTVALKKILSELNYTE